MVLFPVHSPLNIGALLFNLSVGISPPLETIYNAMILTLRQKKINV